MKFFESRVVSPIYVHLHRLCVGDVILSGGGELISKGIKFATNSRYSHAAIYIGKGRYLESTGELGVAVGRFPLIQVQAEAGKYIGLVDGVAAFDIFRHKSIGDGVASWRSGLELSIQIQSTFLGELGRHYSKLNRLVEVEGVNRLSRKLGEVAKQLPVVDNVGHSDGVFCSELVSLVLEKFVGERVIPALEPEHTSPAAFSRFNEAFRLVTAVDELPDYKMSNDEAKKMNELNQDELIESYSVLGWAQRRVIENQDTIRLLAKLEGK